MANFEEIQGGTSSSNLSVVARYISDAVNTAVVSPVGTRISPRISVVFLLNSMTGISVLTLPYAFSRAGLLLGSLVVLACMLMAYLTATFMCEALAIANALTYHVKGKAALLEADGGEVFDAVSRRDLGSQFRIRERVELSAMGARMFESKAITRLIYAVIVVQMYGSNTVLVVLVNQALSHAIVSALALWGHSCDPMNTYIACVVMTFFIVLPLCLGDLQKTKNFTLIIMVFKFTAIFLFLLVASIKSFDRWKQGAAGAGEQDIIGSLPMWDLGYFPLVFGNAIFMFCQHHMLPSMVAPVTPQDKIPRVILSGFCIIYAFVLAVNSTALVAWGAEAHKSCTAGAEGHFCEIQPMYNLNFSALSWGGGLVGIFIVAYPSMSIANFPIQAITTRNTVNLMLDLPALDATKPFALQNIGLLLLVLVPCFVVALVTQNVQAMIQYVGCYAGLTIAFLFPLILVIQSRRAYARQAGLDAPEDRPLKSPFASPTGYIVVISFYALALAIITKKLFFSSPVQGGK